MNDINTSDIELPFWQYINNIVDWSNNNEVYDCIIKIQSFINFDLKQIINNNCNNDIYNVIQVNAIQLFTICVEHSNQLSSINNANLRYQACLLLNAAYKLDSDIILFDSYTATMILRIYIRTGKAYNEAYKPIKDSTDIQQKHNDNDHNNNDIETNDTNNISDIHDIRLLHKAQDIFKFAYNLYKRHATCNNNTTITTIQYDKQTIDTLLQWYGDNSYMLKLYDLSLKLYQEAYQIVKSDTTLLTDIDNFITRIYNKTILLCNATTTTTQYNICIEYCIFCIELYKTETNDINNIKIKQSLNKLYTLLATCYIYTKQYKLAEQAISHAISYINTSEAIYTKCKIYIELFNNSNDKNNDKQTNDIIIVYQELILHNDSTLDMCLDIIQYTYNVLHNNNVLMTLLDQMFDLLTNQYPHEYQVSLLNIYNITIVIQI